MSWMQNKPSFRARASLALGSLVFVFAIVGCQVIKTPVVSQPTAAEPAMPPATSQEPEQPPSAPPTQAPEQPPTVPSTQAVEARLQPHELPAPGDPAAGADPCCS